MLGPCVKEIAYCDPILLLQNLRNEPWLIFLDSAQYSAEVGRYSYIVFDPFLKIVSKNNIVTVNGIVQSQDPFKVLNKQLALYPTKTIPDLPPFQGGAVGFFAYDLLHHLEKIPKTPQDVLQIQDLAVGFYDSVLAFDHHTAKAWLIVHGWHAKKLKLRDYLKQCEFDSWALSSAIHSNFTQETYCHMVQKVIDYIHAGEIF